MEAEETLFMTVAMVRCFFCGRSGFPTAACTLQAANRLDSLLSFRCCGQMQLIPADKVYFEILSIAGVPA
jgi:hypothetical protein